MSPPAVAGQGASWIVEPYCDGRRVRGRIQIDAIAAGSRLEVVLDGTRKRAKGRLALREGVTTLLTFDGSGSFHRHHDRAFDLADAYVSARRAKEGIGLMVFGRSAETWPAETSEDAIRANLQAARNLGAVQKETRLAAFVREAIEQVTLSRPVGTGGIRRVVVFTDAGEESRVFDVDEVVEYARSNRVIVDAVVFARQNSRSYAEDLDRLARLAHLTGGDVVEIHGSTPTEEVVMEEVAQDVEALATRLETLVDVSVLFCGDAAPQVTVQGPNGVHTDTVVAAGQPVACRGGESPEDTDDPQPAAVPEPASTAKPTGELPSGPPGKLAGLLCLAFALLILGLLGGAAYLLATRSDATPEPDDTPPTPPPSPAPAPPVAPSNSQTEGPEIPDPPPVTPPTRAGDSGAFSMHLPETHIRVTQGDLPPGTRWRFAGRILRVGASAEDNDVVVDLPQISGQHARFELYPSGAVFVEDLGSSNGTWVGSDRIRPNVRTEIPPGTPVALSSQLVVVVDQPHRSGSADGAGERGERRGR